MSRHPSGRAERQAQQRKADNRAAQLVSWRRSRLRSVPPLRGARLSWTEVDITLRREGGGFARTWFRCACGAHAVLRCSRVDVGEYWCVPCALMVEALLAYLAAPGHGACAAGTRIPPLRGGYAA